MAKRAAGKRLTGDARRKTEIILDPARRTRLSAECAFVEHDHRQALGRGIDGGGKTGRAGADDHYVMDDLRIELRRHAEAGGDFGFARIFENRAVWANDQRQLVRQHADPFDHGATIIVGFGVEHEVGITAAREEPLEPGDRGSSRHADQDSAGAAFFDQPDTARDQGAHDDFADIG